MKTRVMAKTSATDAKGMARKRMGVGIEIEALMENTAITGGCAYTGWLLSRLKSRAIQHRKGGLLD